MSSDEEEVEKVENVVITKEDKKPAKVRKPMSDARKKQVLENLARGRIKAAETRRLKKEKELKEKELRDKAVNESKLEPVNIEPKQEVKEEVKQEELKEKEVKEELKEEPKPIKKKKKKVVYEEESDSSSSEEEIVIRRRKRSSRPKKVRLVNEPVPTPPPTPTPVAPKKTITPQEYEALRRKHLILQRQKQLESQKNSETERIRQLSQNMLKGRKNNRFN
tara:strand:- start:795 stop:1457 length:663 start_codon:yes stop_codon:yes gene_type:complete